jgi:hypothetical protein
MKRIVESLAFLPEDVCREFNDWCIFEQAKAATIAWLHRDNLDDLAQIIEDAADYQTLYEASKKVCDAINETWEDPLVILQQKTRVQAFRAVNAIHDAIWFALKDELSDEKRSRNIAGAAISTVAVDKTTQKAAEEEQDQKLLEICQKCNVDIDRFLKQ